MAKKQRKAKKSSVRTRTTRLYPALAFEEALKLAEAIHIHASGERVSRLTLLKALDKSPTSSATQILITSSRKYGLTTGNFNAEHLDLTETGKIASDPDEKKRGKKNVQFKLAIERIQPFNALYSKYKGKKLPAHDVLKDALSEADIKISDTKECIDLFVVNVKFLGLLQTIAGSETLVSIETLLEQIGPEEQENERSVLKPGQEPKEIQSPSQKPNWEKTCFYITPIGEEGSDQRKHSDLFLSSLIEPALKEFSLVVIRADKIGQAGMITSQILEHIINSKLVIVDLSYHNPNVFYEMAIRHACKLPIIQICRKSDKVPFDVNQVRTIPIDDTDIYSFVPRIETYRSEIATHVRAALEGQTTSNPISVYLPGLTVNIPCNAVR